MQNNNRYGGALHINQEGDIEKVIPPIAEEMKAKEKKQITYEWRK